MKNICKMDYLVVMLLTTLIFKHANSLNWQSGAGGVTWSLSCDFNGNDLTSLRIPGEKCGEACVRTAGCTHFVWTDYQGGSCWMKKNQVSQNDAIYKNIPNMVCGIVSANAGGGSSETTKAPLVSPVTGGSKPLECVSYEPFSDSNYPGNVNQAIKNTLSAVRNQGFSCIKTYYTQYYGLKIADYASQYNLKIVLGIRMGESFTESEIQGAINSCKSFTNIIAIYAGNENLPNQASSNDVIKIKNRVKDAGCNVPFGTVQTIGYFLQQADRNLVNQMDWLGYNVYPFFSNLGSRSAADSLRAQINQLKNAYGSDFSKFRISETGWPTDGGQSDQGNPSTIDKAKSYADQFASMICSGEINTPWVSYFTFFDPVYKKNVPEFERHFGIADRNGNPKWNIANLHC